MKGDATMNKYTDDSYDSYVADICKRYRTRGTSMNALNGAAEQERNESRTKHVAPEAYSSYDQTYRSRNSGEYMTADDFLSYYNRHRDDMGAGFGFATGRSDNVNGRASYLQPTASSGARSDTKGIHAGTGSTMGNRSANARSVAPHSRSNASLPKTQRNAESANRHANSTHTYRAEKNSASAKAADTTQKLRDRMQGPTQAQGIRYDARRAEQGPANMSGQSRSRNAVNSQKRTSQAGQINSNNGFYVRDGEVSAISAHQIKRNPDNSEKGYFNKTAVPETKKRGSLLTRFFRRSKKCDDTGMKLSVRISDFAAEWFPPDDKEKRVKGKSSKAPISVFAAIAVMTLSFIMMISGSVMSNSISKELGELDSKISTLTDTEQKLQSDLDVKNNMLYIRDVAQNELGMVSSDFIATEYSGGRREDSVEFYGSGDKNSQGSSSALLSAVGSITQKQN